MKVKVCGLAQPDNIALVAALNPDLMGFIFYPQSQRAATGLDPTALDVIPSHIERVGVFVNQSTDFIEQTIRCYSLSMVQLHGHESPEQCARIRSKVGVIKVRSIACREDFALMEDYAAVCDYFLLDTATPLYGGSGLQFDWRILEGYHLDKPFFLSGGISLSDTARILEIAHPMLCGVDINSRFETASGVKNIDQVREFINTIK